MDFFLTKIIFFGAVFLPPLLCIIIAKLEDRNLIRWFLYGGGHGEAREGRIGERKTVQISVLSTQHQK